MFQVYFILGLVCATSAFPQAVVQQEQIEPGKLVYVQPKTSALRPKVYEVRSEVRPHSGDGQYGYFVETSDGLQAQQVGYVQRPLASQVAQGSYTTFDEFGNVVLINYIADKDGFRTGELPTPPPLSAEHIAARENILNEQSKIRKQHLSHLVAGFAAHGMQIL